MDHLTIRKTGDGSSTLFHQGLNETYHSIHGALTESRHVFIDHGACLAADQFPEKAIEILEIGFGTGLNACLTFELSSRLSFGIRYCTIEKYPLPEKIWSALEFPEIDLESFRKIHHAPWNEKTLLSPEFELLKKEADILNHEFSDQKYHVIYFDAFAPDKQPDLWSADVLTKMYRALTNGGILVTYCAKGQFKRNLKAAGFSVESLPGPPGKREMVRAIRR